mmetsp:Transcript_10020/g.16416  ORF Transcript_10020/g.16416 Transcript_10020/m.16416 type:complete len:149 (+) Transcript_10020:212-658(+)
METLCRGSVWVQARTGRGAHVFWLRLAGSMDKYGTHNAITCDSCACRPIQGYRYRCLNCPNHDLCETCYEKFTSGELNQNSQLARVNKVSANIEDHKFQTYSESDGSFVPISGKPKQVATAKSQKKVKPNEPCPCSSGKKYKKCCGKP